VPPFVVRPLSDSTEQTKPDELPETSSTGGRRLIGGAVLLLVAVGIGVWAGITFWPRHLPPPLPEPRQPILPNLSMPPLTEFYAGTGESTEHPYLYFTATIQNRGRGPFAVHAVRTGSRGAWRVSQRFREEDGSTSEHVVPDAQLVWGGHGHNHWHVRLGASYELLSPAGNVVREYSKVGFCFFDQLPVAPPPVFAVRSPVFPKTTCSGFERNSVDMGLSPGWRDPYQWTLPDQRLDLTGLPDGVYRLVARADPDDWFRESDEQDNSTWAELRLTTSVTPARVRVLKAGPHR
jgi:lysyl oxidase